MPIYSDNEAELEDRLASLLAGAGATSSLAAAAAAMLKDDPTGTLTPRLRGALISMVRVFEGATTVDFSGGLDERDPKVQYPEELVARLAKPTPAGDSHSTATEMIGALLKDLKSLLEAPSKSAAVRVESFLGELSRVENAQAQTLARGSLDLELASMPRLAL